ncbi:amidase family protein [Rubrobacter marinus]|uniref:amidase family protein n=1 Tax=Rubrobacter marinus TaxID=2653852 RepID=UPI001A9FCC42|nr:amidase family protein [Rubrobacter marinus]
MDPVSMPELMRFIEVTSLYLSQSRYDIDGFLSKRPGSHTIGELYDSKRFHPRLDLFTAIAEEAPVDPEEDPDYHRGLAAREEFRRAILNLMASERLDAIVYPNSQVLPPTRQELDDWKWTVLTFPTNALIAAQADLPSICLPAGFAEGDVPVGFELVGKPYGEAELLKLAYAYEKAASPRKPPASTPPLPDEPR